MFQQRLFHLSGIDVGAAADYDVFGTVMQRQVAARIEGTHVAGVQPAVA